MPQTDILILLKNNPNKKFITKEIKIILNINCSVPLKKLRRENALNFTRIKLPKCNVPAYIYWHKK